MRSFLISEYGYLLREGDGDNHSENVVLLPARDFNYLQSLLFNAPTETDDEHRFFLKPANFMGKMALQVQSHVGVLQTPFGTQIEILPKIFKQTGTPLTPIEVRNTLIRMLRFLRDSPFRQSNKARLFDASMPLMEVFLSYFLHQVNELVKRGIRSDYIRQEGNLAYMKGKLLVAQHIRNNLVRQDRFFVGYDEYQINRPENRLVKSSLEIVNKVARHSANQRLCRELLFAFDSVPVSTDFYSDYKQCATDRSMAYYQHVLEWCWLILTSQSPIASRGETKTISLLFPMERIFEDYVAARLRIQFPEWNIKTQVRQHHLAKQNSKNYFLLKPDLVMNKGGIRIVADTKWKLLGQNAPEKLNYSIAQSDMYQMYAYGHKYLAEQEVKEVYLIYPQTAVFKAPLPPFEYEDRFKLFIVPYDLSPGQERLLCGNEGAFA